MNIGYKLYECAENFAQLQLKMALTCEQNGWCMEDGYDGNGKRYLIINPPYEPPLQELKKAKHNAAGAAFAAKRDAIRFVKLSDGNTYGFDCANEDITNFMANWKAAELDGQTEHKVWLDETTKGMVVMQPADFKTVFDIANKSQKEAYVWYGEVVARIAAATSKEELDAIEL